MKAFDRMKEKVEGMETQAEVSAQLTGSSADLSLEAKFKAIEVRGSHHDTTTP